jgi:5-formyltetrahydrofolate cyclo-ligase
MCGVNEKPDIILEKRALRSRIKAWRAGLTHEDRSRAAELLAGQGLAFLSVSRGAVVSGFCAMADELDARPLLQRLAAKGTGLAMPVVRGKGQPLLFRSWAPGDKMDRGVWGIGEPKAEKLEVEPDILLVPLLAFDAIGWRIGYGGGFYDRTLRALRAAKPIVAVGLAYDVQKVDAIPHLDYDERLDWVLTPSGPIRCTG